MDPGFSLSVNSRRLTTPLIGNPFPSPYMSDHGPLISSRNAKECRHTHLGHHQDIRLHTALCHSEPIAGPPETTLHFIHNKHDPVLVAHLSQSLQELGWCWDVSAFSQNRLDDDGCCIRRGSLLRQKKVQLVERVVGED